MGLYFVLSSGVAGDLTFFSPRFIRIRPNRASCLLLTSTPTPASKECCRNRLLLSARRRQRRSERFTPLAFDFLTIFVPAQLRYIQVDRSTGFTGGFGLHSEGGIPSSPTRSYLYCAPSLSSRCVSSMYPNVHTVFCCV